MNTARIGALVPLTAPGWVEAGRHLLAGLQLGVREVNDAGGIDGRPLELVIRDTAADPQRAAAAVDELARLGVAALAGEFHSVVARAAAARADALGVPFLCSSAVLDALTERPTDLVARLAPPQSRGWRVFADFLRGAGHGRIAAVTEPSVYWASGIRILRAHLDVRELEPTGVCDALLESRASALLLLVGHPEPAVSIVKAVRRDPRLAGVLIGAPAGQPEFGEWSTALGDDGTGVPFLRYLPERLTALGERVDAALREQLGVAPSFVGFEGYDTIAVLADVLRGVHWSHVDVEGTRGRIRFARMPGLNLWQWADAPIQVAKRDPDGSITIRSGIEKRRTGPVRSVSAMKTMTCRQLGGPCDTAHKGKTANDVIKAQDAHLKERVAAGDETHREADDAMRNRWKHPVQGLGWYRDAKKTFAALPED